MGLGDVEPLPLYHQTPEPSRRLEPDRLGDTLGSIHVDAHEDADPSQGGLAVAVGAAARELGLGSADAVPAPRDRTVSNAAAAAVRLLRQGAGAVRLRVADPGAGALIDRLRALVGSSRLDRDVLGEKVAVTGSRLRCGWGGSGWGFLRGGC
ncbi:urease accessory UreF family protein [Pyxidicoccus caerfyrddinensis]|uniref:urease accessory UreF family protein n=1 Tax=Pyxidicoccus caerfyrddinensis TaxID=2709663 RepID=UPI003B83822E